MKIKHLLFFLLLPVLVFSQTAKQIHSIEGTVVDSATGQKLPSVNVVVYGKDNNKMISGTATNLAGKFSIKSINKDNIYIKVSSMGYNTLQIDTVLAQKNTTFSQIKLGVSKVTMDAIVVTGSKPMVEFQADKNIINVDRIPGATGSLVDALANSGMVDVDPSSKKVSLRGQSLEIWIDGKPSAMGDVMLSSLPAESVEKVELITNPSAKDNPEGSSAILNIITKKGLLDNVSGSVSLNTSTQNSHYGSLRLGYKTGKFNVYGGIFGYVGEFKNDNTTGSTSYESLLNYLQTSTGRNEYFGNSPNFKIGLDYDPTEFDSYSVTVNYSRNRYDYRTNTTGDVYTKTNTLNYFTKGKFGSYNSNDELRYTGYYKRKFDKKGHEITLDAYYLTYSRISDDSTDNNLSYMAGAPQLQMTNNAINNKTVIIKTDYTNPLSFGTIGAGYNYTYRFRDNNYTSFNYVYSGNIWDDSLNLSNFFKYKENIHALYFTFSHQLGNFGFKGGMRAEKVFNEGDQVTTGEVFKNDYMSYYPTLNLSYKFSNDFQLYFNLGRRVSRPMMDYINPFKKVNHNSISQGNPNLGPTYTNLYELKLSQLINVYYTNSKGNPTYVQTVKDSITTSNFINLASTKTYGAELTLPYYKGQYFPIDMPDFISMFYVKYSFYRLIRNGNYGAENLSTSRNVWNLNANLGLSLWWDLKSNVYFYFMPKQKDQRTVSSSYNYLSASVSKSFMEGKLQISLALSNILNKRDYDNETYGSNYYSSSNFHTSYGRGVSLSFTYTFNNFTEKRERQVDDGRDKSQSPSN